MIQLLVYVLVALVVLGIVYLIGREILRAVGAPPIFTTILYLVMLLVVLIIVLNYAGLLGAPMRL